MSKTKTGTCANCHINFELSKKQKERSIKNLPVFCSETCSLAYYGKTKTDGVKGVHLNSKGLWLARIQVGKKRLFLGSSKEKEVAVKLRLEAEKEYFGKYDRKYLE